MSTVIDTKESIGQFQLFCGAARDSDVSESRNQSEPRIHSREYDRVCFAVHREAIQAQWTEASVFRLVRFDGFVTGSEGGEVKCQ